MPLVEMPLKKEDKTQEKEKERNRMEGTKNLIIVICGDTSSTLGLRTVSYTRCTVLAGVTAQNNVF
jgi:hypothetical protein